MWSPFATGPHTPECLPEVGCSRGSVCAVPTLCPRDSSRSLAGGTPPTPRLQKPLCSGPACPNLPLGPLRGPGKKWASLLSMCPSNSCPRPPPLRSSQGVHKRHQHQHRSCGKGSSGCPTVHQLFVSWLVGLTLALTLSVVLLSMWDPLPLSFHLQGRVGDGGLPLKFRKSPPLHSPPTPPFLLGV